ncbi:HD domain-containing phosphohydrolase [Shewanella subflava]|uniref:Transporter substrate-binding domain-containing protein n=1 Tax=Shewanella subflava TaxID=2986476 RepID=A0ABT3I6H8_9GAMM|nr:HD domain-containing phosphohydrolase [Shewanella subflava]MCW3171671.1 transporter substrate-binding domain-containing protein [Shewanella subflava]
MSAGGKRQYKRFTIRFTVVSIFIIATLFTASIAIGLQFYFSQRLATEAALTLYDHNANTTGSYLTQVDNQAINTTRLLAHYNDLYDDNGLTPDSLNMFTDVMNSLPFIYAIYIGLDNGDLFELVNLNAHSIVRNQLGASQADRWVIIEIKDEGENRVRHMRYYDNEFTLRTMNSEPTEYRANIRPWYTHAIAEQVSKTPPYLFQNLQSPGVTYSTQISYGNAVLGVDIALSSISDYLNRLGKDVKGENSKEVFIFEASGDVIASNIAQTDEVIIPASKPLQLTPAQQAVIANTLPLMASNETNWPPIDFAISGKPQGYSIDLLNIVAEMTGLTIKYNNGFTWAEFIDKFKDGEIDILHSLMNIEENANLGVFSDTFLNLPFAVVTQDGTTQITAMSELNNKRVAIPKGWSIGTIVKQYFPDIEVVEYQSTLDILQAVHRNEVFAALDNSIVLHYTAKQYFIDNLQFHETVDYSPAKIDSGLSIVMKPEHAELIEIINLAIKNITPAQINALRNKWFSEGQSKAPDLVQGTVPYKQLIDISANPTLQKVLNVLEIDGVERFVYVTPLGHKSAETEYFAIVVPTNVLLASTHDKVKKSILVTMLCLLLVLPLSWLFASPIIKPINLLALENTKIKNRQYDDVLQVQSFIKEIDDLAFSMVDMSESIKVHEQNQKALMEAFIKLIAQAIDDKSPYTAGHCNRVPELGLMLAESASNSKLPAFKDFKFKNDDEHREFRIAAWLHDCGKITTPEHIVDKGTKLEVIYNRIHEIRMRFEVLWRDAQIHYYSQCIANPDEQEAHKAELDKAFSKLTEDFTFIANANVGGEFMDQAHIDKLNQLAKTQWVRHFSDKIGLSPVEELNYPQGEESLPVTESLLSNKPQHIIKRDFPVHFDEKFGIKMDIPEHLYNQGELHNLAIGRGTLTAEDRFKINEHITSTIKMLENLPFPPELARVPRYASTHHETLKGTGYPRKLSAEQLSIPERILVLADIFEALTAADRPYKKAKPMSVAISILHKMALEQHVDIEVFKLFLSSGVYLEYAQRFLDPNQIDEVDINQYLN